MRVRMADLEIERNTDPFEVEMADGSDGSVFAFTDPKALPAELLVSIEGAAPADQLAAVLGDRASEFMARADVDGYTLEAIMGRYAAHFGIGSPGEGFASPR